ncbi:hypothetical protein Hanom_Chr12g01149931 [Helianthus anomalus]
MPILIVASLIIEDLIKVVSSLTIEALINVVNSPRMSFFLDAALNLFQVWIICVLSIDLDAIFDPVTKS